MPDDRAPDQDLAGPVPDPVLDLDLDLDRWAAPDPGDPTDPATSPYLADPLAALADAGFPVGGMPAEQRSVLAALTPAETEVLLEIKRRLDDSEPEVRAHEAGLIGGLFF